MAPRRDPPGRTLTNVRAEGALDESRDAVVASHTTTAQLGPGHEPHAALIWWAGWAFVTVGCVLRIMQYAANRSLSIDESYLALNVVERSPRGLLHTLDFTQAAPVGFLEGEKVVTMILGRSEYALRLLPLLASLLAIVVFYRIARAILSPGAATVGVATFALLDPLIYYSATTKQYAFDVVATLMILAAALMVERRSPREKEIAALGVFGALLVWFSHASVFGLAALGLLLLRRAIDDRRSSAVLASCAAVAAWSVSFGLEYLITKSNLENILGAFQQGGGAAFNPANTSSGLAFGTLDRFRFLVGLEDITSGRPVLGSVSPDVNRLLTLMIIAVLATGYVSILRRNRSVAFMLVAPSVLAVVIAESGQYPLVSRTVLFAFPAIALCVGEGVRVLVQARIPHPLRAFCTALAMCAIAAIAILPAIHAFRPRANQEMKEALRYLGVHHEPGDGLYASFQAQYAVAYYHLCGCSAFDPATVWPFSTVSGSETAVAVATRSLNLVIESGKISVDTEPLLRRRRVWVLLAELPPRDRTPFLEYFGKHGTLRQRFIADAPSDSAAALYLYDVTGTH